MDDVVLDRFRRDWLNELAASKSRRNTLTTATAATSTSHPSASFASNVVRSSPTLLGIPGELRNRIYLAVFAPVSRSRRPPSSSTASSCSTEEPVSIDGRPRPRPRPRRRSLSTRRLLQPLLTCTQIYTEASLLAFSQVRWRTRRWSAASLHAGLGVLPVKLAQQIRHLEICPSIHSKDYDTLNRASVYGDSLLPSGHLIRQAAKVGFVNLGGKLDGLQELRIRWSTRRWRETGGIFGGLTFDMGHVLENTAVVLLAAAGGCRSLQSVVIVGWKSFANNDEVPRRFAAALRHVHGKLTHGQFSHNYFGWEVRSVDVEGDNPVVAITVKQIVDGQTREINIELEGYRPPGSDLNAVSASDVSEEDASEGTDSVDDHDQASA